MPGTIKTTTVINHEKIKKPQRRVTAKLPSKTIPSRRSGKSERIENIIRVAKDMFTEKHFSDVGTKEITSAAGINSALLYYYFEDKNDLFCKVVDSLVQKVFYQFSQVQRTALTPEGIIMGWLETHIREFELIRSFIKISTDYSFSDIRSPEIDRSIRNFYDMERRVLTAALSDAVAVKRSRPPLDVGSIATLVSTFLDGVITRSLILQDFQVRAAIENFSQHIMSILLSGSQTAEEYLLNSETETINS